MKFIASLFEKIIVILGVLLFSQGPAFISQYQHRLGGHVEELHYQVEILTQTASYSHKSLSQFIDKFLQSGDPDFSLQGKTMDEMVKRYTKLSHSLNALQQAPLPQRPVVFVQTVDPSIAKRTLNDFQVTLTINSETLMYACVGFVLSIGACALLRVIFRRLKIARINKKITG